MKCYEVKHETEMLLHKHEMFPYNEKDKVEEEEKQQQQQE